MPQEVLYLMLGACEFNKERLEAQLLAVSIGSWAVRYKRSYDSSSLLRRWHIASPDRLIEVFQYDHMGLMSATKAPSVDH